MEEKTFITRSARETEDLGSKLSHNFKSGDIVILTGPLGAGKTTFVQGVGKALNVKSRIISPTFVLVRKHKVRIKNQESRIKNLYHIDLYRLEDSEDIKNLGLEDIFEDQHGIFLIEWGEKHENLKASRQIDFQILEKDSRKITVRGK
jgi:tRNA threonylcarbamoyl adenosine modification protein YjeE